MGALCILAPGAASYYDQYFGEKDVVVEKRKTKAQLDAECRANSTKLATVWVGCKGAEASAQAAKKALPGKLSMNRKRGSHRSGASPFIKVGG